MNLKVNVWPGLRVPLSNRPVLVALVDMSLADVTVCGAESLFVHVTVVPTLTERV